MLHMTCRMAACQQLMFPQMLQTDSKCAVNYLVRVGLHIYSVLSYDAQQ
jgi:hypothetical protein